jgi:hypothetical protein
MGKRALRGVPSFIHPVRHSDCNRSGTLMRVHPNQINPNAQLDAMYAAQKAAAKREAEATRKKLLQKRLARQVLKLVS